MTKRSQLTRDFVKALPSSQLHGLALKLRRSAEQNDWSDGQEWLWGIVIDELEQRARMARPWARCSCELCWSPFEPLPEGAGGS